MKSHKSRCHCTTTQTLAPIYELVEDERKRVTLRSALDDLLAGNLRVSGEARLRSSGSVSKINHKVKEGGGREGYFN